MINEFIEDRTKWLLSGRYQDYIKFCKKYKQPYSKNDLVYEITLHKCRANVTNIPKKMIEESMKWLEERGYSKEIR